jgi:Mat/Ecp fimbriae periplasmic chaperone
MKRKLSLLSVISLFLLASPAHAQFVMSEMIIDFPSNGPHQHDVEIISKSTETQYIATETYVVEHAAEPNQKRTLFTNPVKSGLLVTPNKMVLPPQARKLMRFLVLASQSEGDLIYRVTVKPVIQGVDEKSKRLALKVLVGYDALVIVRPKDAKVELVGERKGNALTLTNKGNTNALLQAGQQCDALGNKCKDINVTRIYAGRSWTVTLPYEDGPAKYRVWDGSTLTDMTF